MHARNAWSVAWLCSNHGVNIIVEHRFCNQPVIRHKWKILTVSQPGISAYLKSPPLTALWQLWAPSQHVAEKTAGAPACPVRSDHSKLFTGALGGKNPVAMPVYSRVAAAAPNSDCFLQQLQRLPGFAAWVRMLQENLGSNKVQWGPVVQPPHLHSMLLSLEPWILCKCPFLPTIFTSPQPCVLFIFFVCKRGVQTPYVAGANLA